MIKKRSSNVNYPYQHFTTHENSLRYFNVQYRHKKFNKLNVFLKKEKTS